MSCPAHHQSLLRRPFFGSRETVVCVATFDVDFICDIGSIESHMIAGLAGID